MDKEFEDLELDDLCGEVEKAPPKTDKKALSPTIKNKDGLNVLIPYSDGKYKSVDLLTCSSDDFVDWVASVYPIDVEFEPLVYRNLNNRIAKYQHIVKFYSYNLFSLKNPVKELASG